MWARRNIVYGVTHDQSLAARALALGGTPQTWNDAQKKLVDKIHEDAAAVAQAHKGADIGTAVHLMTARVDLGEDLDAGPYQADIDAYVAALARAGFEVDPLYVECRLVCDALQMAGTADRILTRVSDRMRFVADIKTGASVDFGGLGWGAQLACYAHGSIYDVEADVRLDTPPMDRITGIIIHLPAGQGRCDLYEIDLVAGYRAAQLANEIRAVRREAKRWMKPLSSDRSIVVAAAGIDPRPAAAPAPPGVSGCSSGSACSPTTTGHGSGRSACDRDDLDAVEAALDSCRPVHRGGRTADRRASSTATEASPPASASPRRGRDARRRGVRPAARGPPHPRPRHGVVDRRAGRPVASGRRVDPRRRGAHRATPGDRAWAGRPRRGRLRRRPARPPARRHGGDETTACSPPA